MKSIIIYATKYGNTKAIAESIGSCLGNAILCDIGETPLPDVSDYECVVLGSPLTAGSIRKEMKTFVQQHSGEMKGKRLGLFLSGLQGSEGYWKRNFSEDLLSAATVKAFVGGTFDPEKCGLLARKVIKLVAKLDCYTSTIDHDKIKLFAQELAI